MLASQQSRKMVKKHEKQPSGSVSVKEETIYSILVSENPSVNRLRQMCVSPKGLLTNTIRRRVWPLLVLGDERDQHIARPSDKELQDHRDYKVVELDVERLLKRYPPEMREIDRKQMADRIKRVIMRTLHGTEHNYYQGFHDIAITVHLVIQNEDVSVAILRKLCDTHFSVFMKPTLVETVGMLQYIYPLVKRSNAGLHERLLDAQIGTMFCLPWLITWYGHNIQETSPHELVARLCDLFIASDPHMPVYLGASIVTKLSGDIMKLPIDQAEVHGFLNSLPTGLPWEALIADALNLYLEFPPAVIAEEAAAIENEINERRGSLPRPRGRPDQQMERWKNMATLFGVIVVGIIAIGVARYYRNSTTTLLEDNIPDHDSN